MHGQNDNSRSRIFFLREHLAHHVKRLRHERGWSQFQLAEASGLHRTHVSRLENAVYNASLETIDQIARAFAVRPFTLLEPPTSEQKAMLSLMRRAVPNIGVRLADTPQLASFESL